MKQFWSFSKKFQIFLCFIKTFLSFLGFARKFLNFFYIFWVSSFEILINNFGFLKEISTKEVSRRNFWVFFMFLKAVSKFPEFREEIPDYWSYFWDFQVSREDFWVLCKIFKFPEAFFSNTLVLPNTFWVSRRDFSALVEKFSSFSCSSRQCFLCFMNSFCVSRSFFFFFEILGLH